MLDQVAMILLGTPVIDLATIGTGKPSAEYLAWVEEQRGEEIDGESEYDYEHGRPIPVAAREVRGAYYEGVAP